MKGDTKLTVVMGSHFFKESADSFIVSRCPCIFCPLFRHMISSRPLIGQPSFTRARGYFFYLYFYFFIFLLFFFAQKPLGGSDGDGGREGDTKKCFKASWRRCAYPHRLRDSLSPVCGIFFIRVTQHYLAAISSRRRRRRRPVN